MITKKQKEFLKRLVSWNCYCDTNPVTFQNGWWHMTDGNHRYPGDYMYSHFVIQPLIDRRIIEVELTLDQEILIVVSWHIEPLVDSGEWGAIQ